MPTTNGKAPTGAVKRKQVSYDDLLPVATQRLAYEPETGVLRWRNGGKAGKVAGTLKESGYIVIGIDGVQLRAHRIAFYLMHGYAPEHVDHINGNGADNSARNLRAAAGPQNSFNHRTRRDSKTGIRGVGVRRSGTYAGMYRATINDGGKKRTIGVFRDPVIAWWSRASAAQRIHGAFMAEGTPSRLRPELATFIGEEIVRTGRAVWQAKKTPSCF